MQVNLRPLTVTASSANQISKGGDRYSPSINRKPVLADASSGPSKKPPDGSPRGEESKPRNACSGGERKSRGGRPPSRSPRRPWACAGDGKASAAQATAAEAHTTSKKSPPRLADMLRFSPRFLKARASS